MRAWWRCIPALLCLAACAPAAVPQDVPAGSGVLTDKYGVLSVEEAREKGWFEYEGRWFPRKLKKRVRKWRKLDEKHGDWSEPRRLDSKHYRIVTNVKSHLVETEIAPFLDELFRTYTKMYKDDFGLSAKAADKKFIYIHKSYEDYANHNRVGGRPRPRGNPGFIRGGSELVVYYDEDELETFFQTALHEGAHQFVMAMLPGATFPIWLDEALAVYMEGCTYSRLRRKMTLGHLPISRLQGAQHALRERGDRSIEELFLAVPPARFGAVEYDLAWSFVYFLTHGEGGRLKKPFIRFLRKMNGAGTKLTPGEIFRRISGYTFKDLDERWRAWIPTLKPDREIEWALITSISNNDDEALDLRAGDAIVSLAGRPILSRAEWKEAWASRPSGRPIDLVVKRFEPRGGNPVEDRFRVLAMRVPAGSDIEIVTGGARTRERCLLD